MTGQHAQWRHGTRESHHAKDDSGNMYGEISPLVPVMLMQWHRKNKLLVFPWINFNAVILQQVEIVVTFMPYFRSTATHTLWLLQKIKFISRVFQYVSRSTSESRRHG